MSDSCLEKLIAEWLDGRLDAEGSKILQKMLLDSAENRSAFHKYALLDAALRESAEACEGGDLAGSRIQGIGQHLCSVEETLFTQFSDAKLKPSYVAKRTLSLGGYQSVGSARVAAWIGAIAVGFLLTIPLLGYLGIGKPQPTPTAQLGSPEQQGGSGLATKAMPRQPPAPIATLAFAKQADWGKSQLEVGQSLLEGETVSLKQGNARISVGVGAEIVTEAPCSLTFLSSNKVQLHQGVIAVDVAPWAKGFTVVTDDMDLVDLGTKFTVATSPDAKTEATVLEGLVRVHVSNASGEQRRGLLLTEGQRVSINGSGVIDGIRQEDVNQLLRSLDFGAVGPYRPVVLHNTGLGLSVGDEDQHWRVVAGPEGSFSGTQFASVCVPHSTYLPNDPQTSQWISIEDWNTAVANSTYTFQAVFDLAGYDLSTMQIFGRFLADNGIAAVRVNGQPVEVQSWVDNVKHQPFGYQQFRFVNITEGLLEGRNVIEVDVRNGMQRVKKLGLRPIPNPMALRVEWYAFGRDLSLARVDVGAQLLPQHYDARLPTFASSASIP